MTERPQPRPELLKGRSAEVAKGAEQRAREMLGRHPGLVGAEVVDMVAQREAGLAVQEYGRRRLDGRANDNSSRQRGLTLYVTPEARGYITELSVNEGYEHLESQVEEVSPGLFALRLP